MKLNKKSKITVLIYLGILFALLPIITTNLSFIAGNKSSEYSNVINIDNENLEVENEPKLKRAGYWNLTGSPIFIDDSNPNYNWSKTATDNDWCSGSGTWGDPYIIENVTIDGGNSSHCIEIKNSDVSFRIENCTLYNAGTGWSSEYAGIELDHVNNGTLLNNKCSKNMYGISVVSYSNNNTIYGNNASDNFYTGISLNSQCNNNTVSGNNANNNSAFGINLSWSSNNNTVTGNTANKNHIGIEMSSWSKHNNISYNYLADNTEPGWSTQGIRMSRTENNSIIGNTITGSGSHGIRMTNTNYTTVSENIITDNKVGIETWNCNNNTFLKNNLNSNYVDGIRLYHSHNNEILENTANYNGYNGILVQHSKNNTVSGNTANNNNRSGIRLYYYSDNNIISENSAYNNEKGINLIYSDENRIYLNCFSNNILNGFDNGTNNQWDNGTIGNYWDDYTGADANNDGIGDVPYNITGSAGSQDRFPLKKCPIPSQDGGGIPIELIVLISVISGGAVIGVATLLLIRHKRKSIK